MSALFDRLTRVFEAGHARDVELLTDAMAPPDLLRPAAVLIAVTERGEPGVLLTHRPETMRSHAGQAAFPGGKIDPGEDAIEAALREKLTVMRVKDAAKEVSDAMGLARRDVYQLALKLTSGDGEADD